MINVEGGCATASFAFHGAWKDVLSGQAEVSLAIGVEKLVSRDDPERTAAIFATGIDQLDRQKWLDYYAAAGAQAGKPFETGPGRTVFMDTYAMQAAWHMRAYGTTQRQIAVGASKNHHHGSLNPKAQYRFEVTVDEVLADREISFPLTRAMCSPLGDGAAAGAAVLGGRAGELPARGAGTRGARAHQPAVRRQVPQARRAGAVAHRRRQGLCTEPA